MGGIYAEGAVSDPETALLSSGPMLDTRPRTIPAGKKCGGSPYGTTTATCMDNLYCNYQSPTFAKCVMANKREDFAADPPHECGGMGAQCMGDSEFVASLGAGRTGRCCKKGLACVFQAPYVGLCADPQHYVSAYSLPKELPATVDSDYDAADALEKPVDAATPVGTPTSLSGQLLSSYSP
jgi:hypothetical protein